MTFCFQKKYYICVVYTEIGIDSGKSFATDYVNYVNFSGYKIPKS
jgi:hypothetical protein